MDRKMLLTLGIAFAVFFSWQKFVMTPKPEVTSPVTSQTSITQAITTTAQPIQSLQAGKTQTDRSHDNETSVMTGVDINATQLIQNESRSLTWGAGSQAIQNWEEKSYSEVNLEELVKDSSGILEFAVESPELAYLSTATGKLESISSGEGRWIFEDQNIRLTRSWQQVPGKEHFRITYFAQFKTIRPKFSFVSIQSAYFKDHEQDRRVVYWSNKEVTQNKVKSSPEIEQINKSINWVAITNRYFVASVINRSPVEPKGLIQPMKHKPGTRINLVYPISGDSIEIPLDVYIGPKKLNLLRSVEPSLDHVVDFGFFTWLAYPILKFLNYLFQFVHNYGIAIIFITVLLKIVTFPLTYKGMKSMQQMAKLQPQIQKIKDKYGNDKQAQQREMVALMRSGSYNPLAGCLPILLQMPVFFALYQVLYNAMELYKSPFGGWIHDLSLKDPYFVTPVAMTALMWLQQKLTPSTVTDPIQKKMFQWMPVFFGLMMLGLPSGLTIYMLTNTVAGIIQQLYLNKKLGITPPKPEVITVQKVKKTTK